MFEKVNPCHPDKVADRIAGAIVDLAYKREENPRVAVEVLLGHGFAYVIIESSQKFEHDDVQPILDRICGLGMTLRLISVQQDKHLAGNQQNGMHCGDNGIFKGAPVSEEERQLTDTVDKLFGKYPTDGKYIITDRHIIACQSFAFTEELVIATKMASKGNPSVTANPLGEWTGGLDVDSGATNRKLGSDMGRGVTGGGLHGKDLTKADVSVNIVCHLLAQEIRKEVTATCAIGDKKVTFINDCGIVITTMPYDAVVVMAREYIEKIGGFEKFAEWGLIRPV